MAEHAYLGWAPSRTRLGAAEYRLSAKRNIPIAWSLPFDADDRVRKGSNAVLAAPVLRAHARLKQRLARLAPLMGVRLAGVLEGFASWIAEQQPSGALVFDATEVTTLMGSVKPFDELIRWAATLDGDSLEPDALQALFGDSDETGVKRRASGDRLIYELEGWGAESSYPLVGGSTGAPLAWLRPPSTKDAARARVVADAMNGYQLVHGPVATEEGLVSYFSHPRHALACFAVGFDAESEFSFYAFATLAKARRGFEGDGGQYEGIAFGPRIGGKTKLAAWAGHVAEYFACLSIPGPSAWWQNPGAEAFAARMHALEADRDALVAATPARLAHAIERFATLSSPSQSLALDVGPFGALVLDRVTAPEWEPHVHARFEPRHGDASWCAPDPELFVSPFAQQQLVADFLARAFAAADSEAPLTLEWPRGAPASNQSPLVVRRLGVEPARFTAGFQPARATDLHEAPATYVFVGANLVIVTAEGSRVSFRFAVPPGLAEQEPFVSGWWTARSGERFASVLRVGTQVWRFDIGGHLLEAQR